MKRLTICIWTIFFTCQLKAQIGFHDFTIYGNGGISLIDNFDYKNNTTAFGEFGLKFHLFQGISAGINVNSIFFKKSINPKDFVVSYYTQYNSTALFLMYENEFVNKWFLGLGGSLNFGYFTGKIYDNYGASLNQTSGILDVYLNRTVYNYTGYINLRRYLTKRFDIQAGLTFNDFQSYYLDMFKINNKTDSYIVGYMGLVYKFGQERVPGKRMKSRRLRCPRFKF